MKKTTIAGLVGLLFTSSAFAADVDAVSDDVLVTANRIEQKDTEATYASEIHTRAMIEKSGATSLYDYLAQQTSVSVSPYFGNKVTPILDMRGYGNSNGFENIVVSVDGQRLNNIDSSPQLLGAIPLNNIDRIEITKGSGSVLYGDGATAGTIQIYTKAKNGVSVIGSVGNFGAKTGNISAGISEKYFDLYASAADDRNRGFSYKDTSGSKDETSSSAQNIKLSLKPIDDLRLNLEATSSQTDTRYVNSLTLAQFQADPRQNGGGSYTRQTLDSDLWRAGFEYAITSKLKLTASHSHEDKVSEFFSAFPNTYNYDYSSNDIALNYRGDALSVVGGLQTFDGDRTASNNKTTKNNAAVFLQSEYRFDALTLSAGFRREKVKYEYAPNIGSALNQSNQYNAWDLGANYRVNNEITLFTNYNQSFHAPNIDAFFLFGGGFNSFIEPEKVKTFNIGLNHVVANNRLKITAFHANLDNEIYYNPLIGNTNIDKSHKYGLEIQDNLQVTDKFKVGVIYNYIRAIIDNETAGGSSFNGNDLPGVSKNSITANLNYAFMENANLNLSQAWRESTYSADDFANNALQKQKAYSITNVAANYRYKNIQFFTAINNIFEHKNSIQIADDWIYPVELSRTWRIGMKADF